MTIEESKIMWELEKSNTDSRFFSKGMKKFYDRVDELINSGTITYEDFTNDMIDELTSNIVSNGKEGMNPDRIDQIETICANLLKKYEEYTKVESKEGDLGVSTDNTKVLEGLGICQS